MNKYAMTILCTLVIFSFSSCRHANTSDHSSQTSNANHFETTPELSPERVEEGQNSGNLNVDFTITATNKASYNITKSHFEKMPENENQEYMEFFTRYFDAAAPNRISLPPKDLYGNNLLFTLQDISLQKSKVASVIYSESMTLYVEYEIREKSYISLYNASGQQLLQFFPATDKTVHDVLLTEKYIYFVESSSDINTVASEWAIYKIDIATTVATIIAKAEDYSKKIVPRINKCGNNIVFVSHLPDADEAEYILYVYNSSQNEIQELLRLNCLFNPYTIPYVQDEKIYMPEYDIDGWYVLIFDLSSSEITKVYPNFEYKSEYLTNVAGDSNYLAYTNNFDALYLLDFNTGEIQIIDINVFSFALRNNCLVYVSDSSICIYDIENNLRYVVHDAESTGIVYGYFSSSSENITMIGRDENQTIYSTLLRVK